MTRYFYQGLTAAVIMITAASPHSIELTHIHLAHIYLLFLFITIMNNHLELGSPSPSSDSGIGRDDATPLRLHVQSLLHCASSSHLAPADQGTVSFLWTLLS